MSAQEGGLALETNRTRINLGLLRRARSIAWPALVGASCVLAALLTTWPLAANLSTSVLLGTEHETTVQLFMIWTLWWNADRAAHLFAGYWDAPIFFPNSGAFTFSEPEPLTGLATVPLWAAGLSPVLIHNLALLALLCLNGVFAFRLVRALRLPQLPALLAAVLTITLPFIAKVDGVLHLAPLFGILWTLEGLVSFGREGKPRQALWAATGFVVSYLTVQQYTLLFALFAFAAGLVALREQRFRFDALLRLGLAGLGAGAAILFFAWPAIEFHRLYGFTRSEELVQLLSARLADFLTKPATATIAIPPTSPDATGGLFPGYLLLMLALLGVALGWNDRTRGRWVIYLALASLGAGLLALGLNFNLLIWYPYDTLRGILPGLDELRSPFRAAAIMQALLPVLAALALAGISHRAARFGPPLIVALALLAAAENLTVPVPTATVPASPAHAWTAWLRAQPADTVIAHIPFPSGPGVQDYQIEGWRMYAQIDHGKPMVNGYSGFFPPGYSQFQLEMAQRFPTPTLLCQLADGMAVNTLVVDRSWLAAHLDEMAAQSAFVQPIYSDSEVQIYRLSATVDQCLAGAP